MPKKIILPKKGNYEIFQIVDFDRPKIIEKDCVRIKCHYSGVNFADCLMRRGLYPDAPPYPYTPGYEVSGTIEEVGTEVEGLVVGDRVMAGTRFGGYSSHIDVEHSQVIKLPSNWSLEQGASTIVSYLTSYMIFFEQARVRQGDKILIDCASGALGQMSIQLLNDIGVDIYGLTSSRDKIPFLEKLGFKASLHEELNEDDFQIILNSRGGSTIREDFKRLGPNGRVICVGISDALTNSFFQKIKTLISLPRFWVVTLMNGNKGVYGVNALKLFDKKEVLQNALLNIHKFNLTPIENSIFHFSEVGKVHEFLESRKSRGKVLLKWVD